MDSRTRNLIYAVAGVAVAALPCLPMLDMHKIFAGDWPNQVWLMNWVASYIAEHHEFPAAINSNRLIGMPYPIFYGHLFFPLIGVMSAAWNAEVTLRLAAFAIYYFQFFLISRLGSLVRLSRLAAFTLATIVTWSIYPMTNLYNRGAIPEFFATTLLVCAACVWFFVLEATQRRKQFVLANLFVFLFTLSAGSHPITALYGACFLAGLIIVTTVIRRPNLRNMVLSLSIPFIIMLIVLTPWVMATLKFSRNFVLAVTFKHVAYYSRSLDSVYERLMPFPLETKSYKHKLIDDHAVGKHLDMQINVPLLLLFAACLIVGAKNKSFSDRRLIFAVVLCAVTATALIALSLCRGSLDKLGHNFRTIQFAYRLITYINLSSLFGVVFCFWRQTSQLHLFSNKRIILPLVALSAVGLVYKLCHIEQASETANLQIVRTRDFSMSLNKMPDTFYGWDAYSIINIFPDLTPQQVASIHNCPFAPSVEKFGDVETVVTPTGFLQTNIEQFPWNHVVQDQKPLTRLENDHLIALSMPASVPVQYKFVPDPIYATARTIAFASFALWLMLTIISCTIGTGQLVPITPED